MLGVTPRRICAGVVKTLFQAHKRESEREREEGREVRFLVLTVSKGRRNGRTNMYNRTV